MDEVSFGEWLKRQRKAEGWTQAQLALQISCSTSALKKIEAEERHPSRQIVERLAKIFNIPSNEQISFLRFARGDWQSAPAAGVENAPWRTSHISPRSQIPTRLNKLIGREHDVSQARQYLADASTRLVTLIGPPGIGKTSLSQQVAEVSTGDFSDGVFFVALAPLNDPDLVASTIGQTLRFEGRGKSSDIDLLKDGIADKQMLLVLDNFEHILEAAPIVPELLTACPNLKILITSREVLRVPGEWIYPVPPLTVPQPSQSKETDVTATQNFSALSLFAERARAVQSSFKLNPENTDVVTAICSRLDGLPLAIELIAARIRLMSPQELFSRMDDRFTLYADGMRAMPVRQKTLHSAIAWSYDLLTREEQKFFAHLGVFVGGFTLEAASQVTGKAADTLTGIMALLDKSLLQRVVSEKEESRFTMLFTIREFALNRLDEMNEAAKLHDQHLKYFLDLAEQADKEIHGPRQVEWLDRLEAEHDNYRAALDWCITNGDIESALYLIGSLSGQGRFWSVRSYFGEARKWFDKVQLLLDHSQYHLAYATALNGVSFIASLQGDYSSAISMAEESQRICESMGSAGEMGLAGALYGIGRAEFWGGGDRQHAQTCFERSAAIYRTSGNRWEQALALFGLGIVARERNNYEQAQAFFEEGLALFKELEDAFGLGRVYELLGRLSRDQGNYDQAYRMHEQGLKYDRHLRFQVGISSSLLALGIISRIQGDYDQAETLLEEAANICREFSLADDISAFYSGCANLHRGDYAVSKAHFIQFTKINHKLGIHNQVGEGLFGLAAVAAGLQQYERAARLAGAGQAVHDAIAWAMDPNDRIEIDPLLQIARERLGDTKFEALAAEGHAMTMEQAVTYALENEILSNNL